MIILEIHSPNVSTTQALLLDARNAIRQGLTAEEVRTDFQIAGIDPRRASMIANVAANQIAREQDPTISILDQYKTQ